MDFVRHPGLAGKTAFWTIVLGTAMVATVSYVMYQNSVQAVIANQTLAVREEVKAAGYRFQARMEFARRRLEELREVPWIKDAAGGAPGSTVQAAGLEQANESFFAILDAWPDYEAVHLYDLAGRELLRVERGPAGGATRAGAGELGTLAAQHEADAIFDLRPGRIYLSPIRPDPALEGEGRSARAIAAAGVMDATGNPVGVLVLDIAARLYLDIVRATTSPRDIVRITNESGGYLMSAAPDANEPAELHRGTSLPADIPALAPVYTDAESFTGTTRIGGQDYLGHASRVNFDPENPDRFIVIGVLLPRSILVESIQSQRNTVILVALGLIGAAVIFALLMARAVSAPIRLVTAAASRIAGGERDVDLASLTDRQDETGELARAFSEMSRQVAQREQSLAARSRELERSNEDLGQFAYVASHDLQQPLRMVAAYLDLLRRRYDDRLDDDAREFIGYAVDGAQRMKLLINHLLAYSRAGSNPLTRRPVELDAVVASAVRTLKTRIEECGAEIAVAPLPRMRVDAPQVERLFINLIENALKYRSEQPPRVAIAAERVDDGWQVSVADNGIGIDPRFREKVFEIFKRLHADADTDGTGIGLAVCKLVVDRHGGRISVRPNAGGGSVFVFTLKDAETDDDA